MVGEKLTTPVLSRTPTSLPARIGNHDIRLVVAVEVSYSYEPGFLADNVGCGWLECAVAVAAINADVPCK